MLLRLAYLGVTNAFALLRLLPMGDREKDVEILAAEIHLALEFPGSRYRSLVNELCRWANRGILARVGPGNYTLPKPPPVQAT